MAAMDPVTVIEGAVTDLPRDDIDTDQIIPARYMKRVERTGFGEFCFHEWRAQGLDLPPNPILVAGDNFGCGSSREHAPWALTAWGIRAVISSSFADIFRSNALKNGLLPIEVPPEELARLFALVEAEPDAALTVDLEAQEVRLPDGSAIGFSVDAFARRMILDGTDELGYLLSLEARIADYEAAHPPRVSTL